jgi:FkbM family methyltransferase
MLPYLVDQCVFGTEPFCLFDVGCAGGIDSLWRLFGDQFSGVGFDPQQDEIERLRRDERSQNVKYVAALIGLGTDHEFNVRRRADARTSDPYFDPLQRSSAAARWNMGSSSQSNVIGEALTKTKFSITEYAKQNGLSRVDFIKIDTDGFDLEAAISATDIIRPCNVLGFMIESPFTGSDKETANSFHNIDRFMREQGFMLYVLAQRNYSRAALPAPFVYRIPAQTVSGQLHWADAVYLRDGASPQYRSIWGQELSTISLLKLAALYELFQLPDCAAELIVVHRDRIAELADPEKMLDRLTPQLNGRQLTYNEYVAAFRDHPEAFFPDK